MDIKGVELFRTGRWNNVKTFDAADLDAIVESFAELAMAGRVPLKIGHNPQQPFTDGQPALGWVTRLWRDGDTLMADFGSMPRTVYEAVKAGLHKFVSIELLRDVAFDGREFPWVLGAVALLGADIPAVRGLKDLQALAMSRRAAVQSGARVTFTRDVSQSGERNPMGDEKKDLEALTARLDALSGKLETFTAENATLKVENARLKSDGENREKAIRKEKVDVHRAAIILKFNTAVNAKLISAAPRTRVENDPAYKDDERVLSVFTFDYVDAFIKENQLPGVKAVNAGGGDGTDRQADGEHEGEEGLLPSEKVVKRTKFKLANDQRFKGASFTFAQMEVLREDPKLAEDYRSEPGIKGGKAA